MALKLNIIFFIAALLLLGIFLFALPPDPDAPRYENRSMAGPPVFDAGEVFSGKFTDDLEAFLLDRIAYRTGFLAFSSIMEDVYGVRIGGAIRADIDHGDLGSGMVADPNAVYREPPSPGTPGAADGSGGAGATDGSGGAGAADGSGGAGAADGSGGAGAADGSGANGAGAAGGFPGAAGGEGADEPQTPGAAGVYPNGHVNPKLPFGVDTNYHPDAVMYSDFYVDTTSVSRYVEVLNEYRQNLPESVRIYCLLVPTQVEFLHERYNTNGSRQILAVQRIYDMLDSGITPVDAYNWIAGHVADEYLYFRTDHHWTAVGAYYAYLAFAQAAGFAPVTIDNYIECAFPDYIGTFGRSTQNKTVLEHPDTLYYYQLDNGTVFTQGFFYIPEDMDDLDYKLFMNGDHPIIDYTSSNENGKTLVVIKESYANAFIPWVSPSYERVIVIDPRLFEGKVSEYLQNPAGVDLLFLTSAFTPSLPAFVENVAKVR